jgi:hypothetical protein
LTYVAVVLVVGIVAALVAYRRGLIGSGAGEWFREQIVGAGRGRGDDLVERLARCLADETVALGASYAVPGFIGVVLPRGVYRAASATKPQLVAEIVARYTELMADQARREGRRQEFLMPAGYTLRLVLACGPRERSVASFEPIGDVHAALGLPTPEMPALRPGISTGMGAGISTGMGDGRQLVSSGSFNATALNATAVNGTAVNGTAVNGTALNRHCATSAPSMDSAKATPVSRSGTRWTVTSCWAGSADVRTLRVSASPPSCSDPLSAVLLTAVPLTAVPFTAVPLTAVPLRAVALNDPLDTC